MTQDYSYLLAYKLNNNTLRHHLKQSYPVKQSPLVHCITSNITTELLANALLFTGAKAIMASEISEIESIVKNSDSLLVNLGQITRLKKESILLAGQTAKKFDKPFVLDLVGINASNFRYSLVQTLIELKPSVVKGNLSEIRTLCGLETKSKGVDADRNDTNTESVEETIQSLKDLAGKTGITFLATGQTDIVVSPTRVSKLFNGVNHLNSFVGTGDIIGALVAGQLTNGSPPLISCISAVSYLNLCGEKASKQTGGLNSFRLSTLDYLSLLYKSENWFEPIKGELYNYE